MRIVMLSLAVMLCLSVAACRQAVKAGEPQLTSEEVVRIAEATARAQGYDLGKYNMTGCHYEFTKKDNTWTVFFELKPPTPPGGHFQVWVDDWTGKATLMPGE